MSEPLHHNTSWEQEVQDLATILRNLKCEVDIDPPRNLYRINNIHCAGPFSFIAMARRALERAQVLQ